MVDKVKPLKYENPANGGTQLDMFPTEATPTQDYLAAKGVSFENLDTTTIRGDSGVISIATNTTDRITILANGTVGMGTVTPSATLDLIGTFQYTDGNQAINKFLGTDAAGNATWQNLPSFNYLEVSDTANAVTTSTSDAVLTTMSLTPPAGTYQILFSTTITSNAAGAAISASLYVAGVQVPVTLMKIIPSDGGALSTGSARGSVAINKIITFTAGQTATIQWSVSSGTATCGPRVFNMFRLV